MPPPGNATAPPPLAQLTLRQSAHDYPAIQPDQFRKSGNGKNVLVTGSSRGIGKEISWSFARSGYNVAVTARKADEVSEAVKEISEACPEVKVVGMPADGCKRSDLERLAAWVQKELGAIDVLICNAGTNSRCMPGQKQ